MAEDGADALEGCAPTAEGASDAYAVSVSSSFRIAQPSLAFQLAAAIEGYLSEFDRLEPEDPPDARPEVAASLERVRCMAGAFPEMSGDLVELLLCHTELLYDCGGALALQAQQREEVVARHREAADRMHRKCRKYFCRSIA